MPITFINNILKKLRNRHFLIIDIVIFVISPLLALLIRLEGNLVLANYMPELLKLLIISVLVKTIIFYLLGIYSLLWNAASVDELAKLILANILSTLIIFAIISFAMFVNNPIVEFFPLSLILIDSAVTIAFTSSSRFSIRLSERANQKMRVKSASKNIGIVGAGEGGNLIARELFNHRSLGKVAVFIDDDPSKQNLKILGIPVEGPIEKLSDIISFYELDKVVIAMPSATGNILRKVTNECIKSGVEVLTVPSLSEIIDNKITFQQIRKVQVEDLLRREPVKTDTLKVRKFIRGKNVLVTGAGGSIGSELCRQIFSFCPKKMILLGHGENSIFDIEHELNFKLRFIREKEKPEIISKIADVRFKEYLSEVFRETKPDIVFHAAAHKHVPLMEQNPGEAILNNILGTKNLVEQAVESDVSEFVLISTDKAVNPTNIMGTTKRIAEIITLNAAKLYNKRFSAVRFGNVLGSRGSVLQTFRKQALTGGPISITHPDIMRYFMTIPEAVQLVLQASVLSNGGEVFILDMGDPVKIVDLARDFIKLSGLKEGIDVDIEFCGLRPGEKLYEELFIKGENYISTEHKKILIASNASNILVNGIEQKIENLVREAKVFDREKIYDLLKSIVPEYTPSYYYNNHN